MRFRFWMAGFLILAVLWGGTVWAAETALLRNGKFSFVLDGPEAEISELLPGERAVRVFRLNNQTEEALRYAVRGVSCEGSGLLLEQMRCSVQVDSREILSGSLAALETLVENRETLPKEVVIQPSEMQELEVVLVLDLNADNRVMGQTCKLMLEFEGSSFLALESESGSESAGGKEGTAESSETDIPESGGSGEQGMQLGEKGTREGKDDQSSAEAEHESGRDKGSDAQNPNQSQPETESESQRPEQVESQKPEQAESQGSGQTESQKSEQTKSKPEKPEQSQAEQERDQSAEQPEENDSQEQPRTTTPVTTVVERITEYHVHRYVENNCVYCRNGGPGVYTETTGGRSAAGPGETMRAEIAPGIFETETGKGETKSRYPRDSSNAKTENESGGNRASQEGKRMRAGRSATDAVEEIDIKVPETGDSTGLAGLLLLLVVSAAAVLFLLVRVLRKEDS